MASALSDTHHLVRHSHVPGFFSEEQGKALTGHRFSPEVPALVLSQLQTYLQGKPMGCAFRKMRASVCPTEITPQGTHACNFLLMWVTFKLGEWLSNVPHPMKYHMHILQAIFKKFWVSGSDHWDMLPCRSWFSDFWKMVLTCKCFKALFRKGLNSLVWRRKRGQIKTSPHQIQSKCKKYDLNKQIILG